MTNIAESSAVDADVKLDLLSLKPYMDHTYGFVRHTVAQAMVKRFGGTTSEHNVHAGRLIVCAKRTGEITPIQGAQRYYQFTADRKPA